MVTINLQTLDNPQPTQENDCSVGGVRKQYSLLIEKCLGSKQDKYLGRLRYLYNIMDLSIQNVYWWKNQEFYTEAKDIRGEVLPIDHYKIFPGELVLDFEYDIKQLPTHKLLYIGEAIRNYSQDKLDINPFVFVSGGTGLHIHFFTKNDTEKIILYKLLDKQFNLERFVQSGHLDSHILSGNHLIRAPGGRKLGRCGPVYKSLVESFGHYTRVRFKDKVKIPDIRGVVLWESNELLGGDDLASLLIEDKL